MNIAKETHPALWQLLNCDNADSDYDGKLAFCSGCPFSTLAERNVNPDDRDEAHYECGMLGNVVWGEDAPCTLDDWRKAAKKELGI